jgi:hypothetical protein
MGDVNTLLCPCPCPCPCVRAQAAGSKQSSTWHGAIKALVLLPLLQ